MTLIFMKIQLAHSFENMVGVENLLDAWKEFLKGKRKRKDVQYFSLKLMDNILSLHSDLLNHTYEHGKYQAFHIFDPKPRNIHKASPFVTDCFITPFTAFYIFFLTGFSLLILFRAESGKGRIRR